MITSILKLTIHPVFLFAIIALISFSTINSAVDTTITAHETAIEDMEIRLAGNY